MEKIKFATFYSGNNEFVSVSGSPERPTYKVEYDDKGNRELVVNGTDLVYEKIQSFKADTDIYKILSRYFGGDVSVLDKNKGFYADITQIPKNFNEFHNKIEQGQAIWSGLPTDFKSMFDNDLNKFVNSIYEKDFESKYQSYIDSKGNKKVDNVAPVKVAPVQQSVQQSEGGI